MAVAKYSNNHSKFSSRLEGAPSNHSRNKLNRQQDSMSANVGETLSLYHGRCLRACSSSMPVLAYHSTTSDPTNHAIGCALSTACSLRTIGSCSPSICLLSK